MRDRGKTRTTYRAKVRGADEKNEKNGRNERYERAERGEREKAVGDKNKDRKVKYVSVSEVGMCSGNECQKRKEESEGHTAPTEFEFRVQDINVKSSDLHPRVRNPDVTICNL